MRGASFARHANITINAAASDSDVTVHTYLIDAIGVAARLRALFERAWVVTEEDVDLIAAGEALEGGSLARSRPVPAATTVSDRRAAVGQTAQAAETEPCSGRQVVQAEAEPHRAGRAGARVGVGERLGVVVVSVHEQKLGRT